MRTCLYEKHQKLGAKIIEFAGWEMPLQYKGVIEEYYAVRQNVGIFDVSHMGVISIKGKEAKKFIDFLCTNNISDQNNKVTYAVMCHHTGGSVDDCLVYKVNDYHYFFIANASNRDKDFAHCLKYSETFKVTVESHFIDQGIIAVQGPQSCALLQNLIAEVAEILPMHFIEALYLNEKLFVSRTGYTGSDGFELIASEHLILQIWESLFKEGKKYRLEPAGLGARDILRLEMGYALYGHELTDSIAPVESVVAWAVKLDKEEFLGKAPQLALINSRTRRYEYPILLVEKGVLREGYPVFLDQEEIGYVTSGGYSPGLKQSIALILVKRKLKLDQIVQVQIRQMQVNAKIVKLPFIKTGA